VDADPSLRAGVAAETVTAEIAAIAGIGTQAETRMKFTPAVASVIAGATEALRVAAAGTGATAPEEAGMVTKRSWTT